MNWLAVFSRSNSINLGVIILHWLALLLYSNCSTLRVGSFFVRRRFVSSHRIVDSSIILSKLVLYYDLLFISVDYTDVTKFNFLIESLSRVDKYNVVKTDTVEAINFGIFFVVNTAVIRVEYCYDPTVHINAPLALQIVCSVSSTQGSENEWRFKVIGVNTIREYNKYAPLLDEIEEVVRKENNLDSESPIMVMGNINILRRAGLYSHRLLSHGFTKFLPIESKIPGKQPYAPQELIISFGRMINATSESQWSSFAPVLFDPKNRKETLSFPSMVIIDLNLLVTSYAGSVTVSSRPTSSAAAETKACNMIGSNTPCSNEPTFIPGVGINTAPPEQHPMTSHSSSSKRSDDLYFESSAQFVTSSDHSDVSQYFPARLESPIPPTSTFSYHESFGSCDSGGAIPKDCEYSAVAPAVSPGSFYNWPTMSCTDPEQIYCSNQAGWNQYYHSSFCQKIAPKNTGVPPVYQHQYAPVQAYQPYFPSAGQEMFPHSSQCCGLPEGSSWSTYDETLPYASPQTETSYEQFYSPDFSGEFRDMPGT